MTLNVCSWICFSCGVSFRSILVCSINLLNSLGFVKSNYLFSFFQFWNQDWLTNTKRPSWLCDLEPCLWSTHSFLQDDGTVCCFFFFSPKLKINCCNLIEILENIKFLQNSTLIDKQDLDFWLSDTSQGNRNALFALPYD